VADKDRNGQILKPFLSQPFRAILSLSAERFSVLQSDFSSCNWLSIKNEFPVMSHLSTNYTGTDFVTTDFYQPFTLVPTFEIPR